MSGRFGTEAFYFLIKCIAAKMMNMYLIGGMSQSMHDGGDFKLKRNNEIQELPMVLFLFESDFEAVISTIHDS